MSKRCEIVQTIRGSRAVDGAGVHMVRVLKEENLHDFDPFLLLDTFDSTDPAEYLAGFPMHPHRGIDTVTYLISGRIDHEDSLGNHGSIGAGECQWMTAGSGILHQEMPQKAKRMLGFQLWLNLPANKKMMKPAYCSLTEKDIPQVHSGKSTIRVLGGQFENAKGVSGHPVPATIYDISIPAGETLTIPHLPKETAFVFFIEGSGVLNDSPLSEKTAARVGEGDFLTATADARRALRMIYFSAKPLGEPVAWGGPIVMNTREQLHEAFSELQNGTFLKQ